MKNEEILSEITSLTPEGKRQVIDYIAFIRRRYHHSPINEQSVFDLNSEDFVGIWQDRSDLKDSSTWVRNLRESEWTM